MVGTVYVIRSKEKEDGTQEIDRRVVFDEVVQNAEEFKAEALRIYADGETALAVEFGPIGESWRR